VNGGHSVLRSFVSLPVCRTYSHPCGVAYKNVYRIQSVSYGFSLGEYRAQQLWLSGLQLTSRIKTAIDEKEFGRRQGIVNQPGTILVIHLPL